MGCALASLLLLNAGCSAGAPPAGSEGRRPDPAKQARVVSVADLIRGLYNRNPEPVLFGHEDAQRPLFARNYDWREDERVYSSIMQLLARVEEAWPQLLQHLDETHYSLTYQACDCAYNRSVGDICMTIVEETLSEAYCRPSPPVSPPGDEQWYHALNWPDIGGTPAQIRAWCNNRNGKRLYELQVEVCESAIQVIPTLDEIEERDRSNCVAAITRQIETLRKLKKPVLLDNWPLQRGPECKRYTPHDADEFREWFNEEKQLDAKYGKHRKGVDSQKRDRGEIRREPARAE
jgi:hypothetical protein